jgi:hypothetical protein
LASTKLAFTLPDRTPSLVRAHGAGVHQRQFVDHRAHVLDAADHLFDRHAVGVARDLAGDQHHAVVAGDVDVPADQAELAHAAERLELDGLVLDLRARGAAVDRPSSRRPSWRRR